MNYCKTCVLPDSRPNISFDNFGNCNCANQATKRGVDWVSRERMFKSLVSEVRALGATYDCVIPVSGGKDSTWQTIKALDYGLNPLCVTWRTPARNELGEANLRNLISLGVNHIDFSVNPNVEKTFTLKAFKKLGSPVIPMHMALHAIPVQMATKFRIPLILWGENSAFEYGGDDNSLKGVALTKEWLKKYGVTNGTVAEDWVDKDLTISQLEPYRWPGGERHDKSAVKAVFLGHFFEWDPVKTFGIAKQFGFVSDVKPSTGLYNFADIDDAFLISVHHWMKWYKFGFTRAWDNLSIEIRNGRVSRDEAISTLKSLGDQRPDEDIEKFCQYVEISTKEFYRIAESFRNTEIWSRDVHGVWRIKDFLIEDWVWLQ
ncbi:MAG: N-acetyl sugar amidotransferase [Betaproteobacteria bacterium]|jgi:N-acetyl sugar amidotransferase|nr:N-acetyl sugar amidotransferase [Betaproteobacteria bacterium]